MITVTAVERKKQKTNRLCYLFLVFLTGCLVGWINETVFCRITEGMLRNRGILYGPWLPIYGIGALGIYAMKPVKKHPVLWNAALGLPGIALEHRRNHLRSQRGKLCPHGAGIPLLAGTGSGADSPKAAARNRSSCLPGIDAGIFDRLYSERAVPDSDSVLEVKA